MPLNGSGNYTPPAASFPFVAGTLIESAKVNDVINDEATALSTMIAKDGQTTLTANIPFNGFKATGMGAGTARTDSATLANIQDGTGLYATTVGGTVDAITLTLSPAIATYVAGQTFRFIAAGANTGAVTVAVSGLAAKAVTKNGTTALAAGDVASGAAVTMVYDGTRFVLVATNSAILNSPTLNSPTITTPTISSPTISGTPVFPDNVFTVGGSADATKKLAFEVDGLTTGTTRTLTIQDEDGTLALTSEFAYSATAGSPGRVPYPPMWMQGLTYSNNGTDAANDLDIAAGNCRDFGDTANLVIGALTKRLDASWVTGTNQGGLSSSLTISDTDYYIHAIKVAGVDDVGFDTSATAANLIADHSATATRTIGWCKRVAGSLVAFTTYETDGGGLELLWSSPTLDIDLAATLTTTRRTDAVKVPLGFSVTAHLNVALTDATAQHYVWISCPDHADLAPSSSAAPLANHEGGVGATSANPAQMRVRTSAAGLIAARSAAATVDQYRVATVGFTWARRN